MCGVNGIFAYHYAANPIDRQELVRTRDHMSARGPDGAGAWVSDDERIGFGHRRLAIIDLSDAAAQPMSNGDGSLVVTFNGEIYNYMDLRRELEGKGYCFASSSDTEVLLHLYADRGERMVHALRGMFAFAIWDAERRRVFLARDPYGIKPLYYADDGWTFRFASQVKALLAGGKVSRDPEPAGLVGFYLWGSVPEPFTSYQEVRVLEAGCSMIVDRIGAQEPKRYHSIAAVYANGRQAEDERPLSTDQASAEISSSLLDSVRHHLVSDVPVGAFLSAGVDSGALVGLMRDAGAEDLQTITIGFEEFAGSQDDETRQAAEVARYYATRHTTRIVRREEFVADLPRIIEAMDQPSIDGINTWFVSKAARELGIKVAVSGLGGDELLGGYPSFSDVPRWVALMTVPSRIPMLGRTIRGLLGGLTGALDMNPKAAGIVEYGGSCAGAYILKRGLFMPWELGDVLPEETMRVGLRRLLPLDRVGSLLMPDPGTAFGRVAALEASHYMRNQLLRDADWASMAHGLEVRVPLVDHVLLGQLSRLQEVVRTKRKAVLGAAPSRPLPDSIVLRSKTGFTTPVATWTQAASSSKSQAIRLRQPWARDWSTMVSSLSKAAA